MSIPNKVRVAGIDYETKIVPEVVIDGDNNYIGSCEYIEPTIYIMDKLSEARKEEVYAHELVHAMLNEAGYSDHDEEQVIRLGRILYQVLKDNTNFFENK